MWLLFHKNSPTSKKIMREIKLCLQEVLFQKGSGNYSFTLQNGKP